MTKTKAPFRVHMGPVVIHDSSGQHLVGQNEARKIGWDGQSPVMYVNLDGTVRCVAPPVGG